MKTIFFSAALGLLLSYSNLHAAPADGTYEGVTSQGTPISFVIANGEAQIAYKIEPVCLTSRSSSSSSGSYASIYNDKVVLARGVNLDSEGNYVGIQANSQSLLYISADFSGETASGILWHAEPFFTGNDLELSFCYNLDVTFTVSAVADTGTMP